MNLGESLRRLRALAISSPADLIRTVVAFGAGLLVAALVVYCSACSGPGPYRAPEYCRESAEARGVDVCAYGWAGEDVKAWTCTIVRARDSTGAVADMPMDPPVNLQLCLDQLGFTYYAPEWASGFPVWGGPNRGDPPGEGGSLQSEEEP